ncbi:MAG: GNAT family N-acetyltransferase [Tissierellia bacterium]|nr:GNAT family N-acetyltransferase [Tissierellia bacterium]
MIREITSKEYHMLKDLLLRDIARNYFLLLGISGTRDVYDKIYGEFHKGRLKAVLFKRKTGVLQFYAPGDFDLIHFVDLIKSLDYNSLIGPESYCDNFLNKGIFKRFEEGAYLSKLKNNHKVIININKYNIRFITLEDLDLIVELYKEVFKSFAPKEVMEKKLSEKRGRGVCIEIGGKIVSVAQSDFETEGGAVIVGVATSKNYRGKGMGTECLRFLCTTLQKEGKDLFLQYNNLDAEGIYDKLGFKKFDQVIHYFKE